MVFEVRRSRFHVVAMIAGMLGLAGLAASHAWQKLAAGEVSLPALMLVVMFGVAALFSLSRRNARATLIAIRPEGLDLPGVAPRPIAWHELREIRAFRNLTGARLDVIVEAEVFAGLRLGHRWTGDHAIKARHLLNGFTIHLQGMDRTAPEIETAIRQYWPTSPPPDAEE